MPKLTFFLLFLLLLGSAFPASAQPENPSQGSFKHPVRLNYFAEERGSGIMLRVTGLKRPADAGEMDAPDEGEEYASVFIDVQCADNNQENCVIYGVDFELAGDMGIIYTNAAGAASDLPIMDLAPGETASTTVTALVNSDDTQLMLLFYHWPTIPYTYPIVFATEAYLETTAPLPILARVGMLARVGPSSDLDFTGVFNRGEQLLAHGRNADGTWLEISFGWVPAEFVETEGDIMSLPVTSNLP